MRGRGRERADERTAVEPAGRGTRPGEVGEGGRERRHARGRPRSASPRAGTAAAAAVERQGAPAEDPQARAGAAPGGPGRRNRGLRLPHEAAPHPPTRGLPHARPDAAPHPRPPPRSTQTAGEGRQSPRPSDPVPRPGEPSLSAGGWGRGRAPLERRRPGAQGASRSEQWKGGPNLEPAVHILRGPSTSQEPPRTAPDGPRQPCLGPRTPVLATQSAFASQHPSIIAPKDGRCCKVTRWAHENKSGNQLEETTLWKSRTLKKRKCKRQRLSRTLPTIPQWVETLKHPKTS